MVGGGGGTGGIFGCGRSAFFFPSMLEGVRRCPEPSSLAFLVLQPASNVRDSIDTKAIEQKNRIEDLQKSANDRRKGCSRRPFALDFYSFYRVGRLLAQGTEVDDIAVRYSARRLEHIPALRIPAGIRTDRGN